MERENYIYPNTKRPTEVPDLKNIFCAEIQSKWAFI